MTSQTTFTLVRHGETEWNAEKRLQGTSDIPLNDTGRAQVRTTAEVLRELEFDFIVCSPLSRARESADILAAELGLEVRAELPEIVERHFGRAEGLQAGDELQALRIEGGFVGAETEDEVAARSAVALARLAAEHPGARIVVVAHGTLIRIALSRFSGTKVETIRNAAHSVLLCDTADGRTPLWTVSTVNGLDFQPPSAAGEPVGAGAGAITV